MTKCKCGKPITPYGAHQIILENNSKGKTIMTFKSYCNYCEATIEIVAVVKSIKINGVSFLEDSELIE